MPDDLVVPPADEQGQQQAALENASGENGSESATEEEQAAAAAAAEAKKSKGGFQRRIDKLVKAEAEAKRENERLQAELARKEAGGDKGKPGEQQAAKPAAETGKPDPSTFETQAEYLDALTDWKIEQREQKAVEARRQTEEQVKATERAKSFQTREESFKEATPDYDEVIAGAIADNVPMSAALFEHIQEDENGAALLYYVAQNPDEAERLAKLGPVALGRELAKIEDKYTPAGSSQAAPTRSAAPRPVSQVGKGTSRTVEKDPGEMEPHEYDVWRKKNFPKL